MPRPKLQRQPCDCMDCMDSSRNIFEVACGSHIPLARQEPPPKSLIVYLSGALAQDPQERGTTLDTATRPHLDAVVRDGWTGLLMFRTGPGALSPPQQLLGSERNSASLPDRYDQWCQWPSW
jgi:hypothetical protein